MDSLSFFFFFLWILFLNGRKTSFWKSIWSQKYHWCCFLEKLILHTVSLFGICNLVFGISLFGIVICILTLLN